MSLPIDFLLATTAIVIITICYVLLLVKVKKVNESSNLLKETYKDLSVQRRTELLEKIKEEGIEEYLDGRKRKPRGS